MNRHACRGVVLLGALTFAVTACSSPAAKAHAVHHHLQAKHKPPAAAVNVTFPGPDGVEASWVVAENNGRGPTPGGSQAGRRRTSRATPPRPTPPRGPKVTLYVTTPAARFRVQAYRIGYYQGKGARLVWQSDEIPGPRTAHLPCSPRG